tara:strand:+ start:613 stop:807 length:195 start_codon:yes stop_codon:yes gene_type:complete
VSDKIDTQGQSIESSQSPLTKKDLNPYDYPINDAPVRTVFTPQEREELKAIIKECLREFHYTTT